MTSDKAITSKKTTTAKTTTTNIKSTTKNFKNVSIDWRQLGYVTSGLYYLYRYLLLNPKITSKARAYGTAKILGS